MLSFFRSWRMRQRDKYLAHNLFAAKLNEDWRREKAERAAAQAERTAAHVAFLKTPRGKKWRREKELEEMIIRRLESDNRQRKLNEEDRRSYDRWSLGVLGD